MYISKNMIALLTLCILSAWQSQSDAEYSATKKIGIPAIVLNELKVSDNTLNLHYEIRNDSKHDIWICDDINLDDFSHFEAFMAKDSQTLLIRRRLDVPLEGISRNQPIGRYIRLEAGQNRSESLLLTMPVHVRPVFTSGAPTQGIEYATRLTIEIGFYAKDLRGMVRSILEEAEKSPSTTPIVYPVYGTTIKDWLGGLFYFNEINEGLRAKDEQIVIPWTDQALKGENILRITIDGVRILYSDKKRELSPPNLNHCTRVKIQFQPSMFEYFFPYASQRSLLSLPEMQYLRSWKTIVVKNQEHLKALAHDISKGMDGGIITELSTANVICYRDNDRITSFTIYDDTSIVTEGKQRFRYSQGVPSLRLLTPQIQPFDLRVQCAANLNDLWDRLRLYQKAEKERLKESYSNSEILYPTPAKWCDAMVLAYQATGMLDAFIMRPHICPSAGEGKNHYALNPNCKPNSPPDTVLLFETKAGWNQHGGPELFTFDNHDPKGGCVLLNNGTVKFIRTKEELYQLGWK